MLSCYAWTFQDFFWYDSIHLDNIFTKCFPEWNYTRYVNEVIVSLPTNYRWKSEDIPFGGYDYNYFEDCMDKLLLNQKIKCGNIFCIDQGGPAVPCSGGKLSKLYRNTSISYCLFKWWWVDPWSHKPLCSLACFHVHVLPLLFAVGTTSSKGGLLIEV